MTRPPLKPPNLPPPSPHSEAPDAETIFAQYVAAHNALCEAGGVRRRPLSDHTRYFYGLIWRKFATFLHEHYDGRTWEQATAGDVSAFLKSVQARGRKDWKRGRSTVTTDRYSALLARVYRHAIATHWVEHSPVRRTGGGVPGGTRPEAVDPFVLAPAHRQRIVEAIARDARDYEARNAALLALMAHQALTPAELVALRCADVQWHDAALPPALHWIRNGKPWPDAPRPTHLNVPAVGRNVQARTLALDPLSAATLQQWLRWRGPCVHDDDPDALFCAAQGRLSGARVYEVARDHISAVLLDPARPSGAKASDLRHLGPMMLRTAALVEWTNTIKDIDEVLRRAGLAEGKSLARLAGRVSPAAMERIKRRIASDEAAASATAARARQRSEEPALDFA